MIHINVSIIIPIYNGERYLSECLDSCVNQTMKDIEIICINDGSTDATESILKKYSEKYRNIIVISQKNQGSGPARNAGIDAARGEFVIFMDADDMYSDNGIIELLYGKAIHNGVNVCGGSFCRKPHNGILTSDFAKSTKKLFFENEGMYSYEEYQTAFGYTRFIFKTRMLKENHIRFPNYRRFQDPPFMVQAMICANHFYAVKAGVYVWRNTDKVIWYRQDDVIDGVIKGIKDILVISKERGLAVLHAEAVSELYEHIGSAYFSIFYGNVSLKTALEECVGSIDEDLLKGSGSTYLKPNLKSDDEIVTFMSMIKKKEKRLRRLAGSYKTILIYGAGRAGRYLGDFIGKSGFAGNMEFVITSDCPEGDACGRKIRCISEFTGDVLESLVLIANKEHANEMLEHAGELGFQTVEIVEYDDLLLFGGK